MRYARITNDTIKKYPWLYGINGYNTQLYTHLGFINQYMDFHIHLDNNNILQFQGTSCYWWLSLWFGILLKRVLTIHLEDIFYRMDRVRLTRTDNNKKSSSYAQEKASLIEKIGILMANTTCLFIENALNPIKIDISSIDLTNLQRILARGGRKKKEKGKPSDEDEDEEIPKKRGRNSRKRTSTSSKSSTSTFAGQESDPSLSDEEDIEMNVQIEYEDEKKEQGQTKERRASSSSSIQENEDDMKEEQQNNSNNNGRRRSKRIQDQKNKKGEEEEEEGRGASTKKPIYYIKRNKFGIKSRDIKLIKSISNINRIKYI